MGSGVIIDSRGYILTNQHVVQDVARIEVTLHDGSKFIGRLIDRDPATDLALVKIDSQRALPVIHFGTSSDLMRGEKVVAIGNPFGYQHTVTEGIISALHRDIPINGAQEYQDLIQTDASINPGNSGGPLVNIDGDMIGLNAAVRVGAQGIGFAIPVDKALDVAANMIAANRKHGIELPFDVQTSAAEGRTEVRVCRLRTQSSLPVGDGDCIKRIGDRPVRNRLEYELALIDHTPGQEVEIELAVGGQSRVERLKPGVRATAGVTLASTRNVEPIVAQAWNVFGVRLKPAGGSQIQSVDSSYSGGLQVVAVRDNSPADLAQLRTGDILVGLLEWQTSTWNNLEWVFNSEEMKRSDKPEFRIIRGTSVYKGRFDLTGQSLR
jgi:serine protease Do